jgi:hydroxyethylthiazole kinase-like uncharacterized protein yjeF
MLMERYVTAKKMVLIDLAAQKLYGIPSIILMENAGRSAALEILKIHNKGTAAIFCGKGNNGGDGFVVARYLFNSGIKVKVFLSCKASKIKNEAPLINLNIIKKMGVNTQENIKTKLNLKPYDLIVDAIFGIGFKGAMPDELCTLIECINKSGKFIYSLDIPSGLNATSGKVENMAVRANKTITFGLMKKGFLQKNAKIFLGKVTVKKIGLPKDLIK